ncbi:MAG: hypothetical protein ABFC63_01970 [Thermoguttaceae bacterium]
MRLRLAAILLIVAQCAAAAENRSDDVIRFHRVFTPEDRVKDWPTDGEKYLPMDAAAFERLVEAAKPRSAKDPIRPLASIAAARYEARLVGERLLGRATLDVVLLGRRAVLLPVDPCNLSMLAPRRPAKPAQNAFAEALFGLAPDGTLALRVERTGPLACEWSLGGRRDADNTLSFRLELPPSPSSQITLELPRGAVPEVDRGIVVGDESADATPRRWRIELGSNAGCRLRIVPGGPASGRRLLALLQESRTYECSARGLELSAQWRLQVHNRPLREIAVSIDPELRLVTARLGERDIPWSTVRGTAGNPTRLVLTLPETIRDCERVIRLGAIGPTTLDRPWRLPRIRAERLFWQEGAFTLLVPEPLEVHRITPVRCAQTDAGPLASPRKGQSAKFQCFDSEATVELLLACAASGPSAAARRDASDDRDPSGRSVTVAEKPANATTAAASADLPPVVSCRLQSWYQPSGAARHVATYELQGADRRWFELNLPAGLTRHDIRTVQIDRIPATWRWVDDHDRRRVAVLIPAGRERSCAFEWTATGGPLGAIGSVEVAMPEPETGLPQYQWIVDRPPGYEIVCGSTVAPTPSASESFPSWSQRLFGPLGRPPDADRFNPFATEQWLAFWNAQAPAATTTPTFAMDVAAAGPARATLVHRPTVQLLGVVVLLGTAGLGCWAAGRRPTLVAAWLVVCASTALTLPAVYAPIATGGVLGSLFCLLWQRVRRPPSNADGLRPPTPRRNPDSTLSMAWPLGVVLLGVTGLLLLGRVARAVAPPEPPPETRSLPGPTPTAPEERHRQGPHDFAVLVPCDSQRNPTGGKLYVPEPLYQELQRAAALAQRPAAWIITGATYRGELLRAKTGSLAVDAIRVAYDLQVFERDAVVQIPLDRFGANTLLDGQPVAAEEDDAEFDPLKKGRLPLCSILVAEPGRHRLEFSLRPLTLKGAPTNGFELPIPRVPAARLEMTLPSHTPKLEVPSSRGPIQVANGRLAAELGPTDRLRVEWPETASRAARKSAVEAEQLLLIEVRPGSVVIATKFKFHAADRLEQVQLAVDSRLRLLPPRGDDPPTAEIGPESGRTRLITLRWPRPVSGQTTLEATFLVGGASGVGNLWLPQIDLLDAQVADRWMAVRTDPSLDCEEQQTQSLVRMPVAEFLKRWNGAAMPQEPGTARSSLSPKNGHATARETLISRMAYRLPAGPTNWALATRPHEPRCTADQNVTLSLDANYADVAFEGLVSIAEGCVFEHRLVGPPGLRIERVSVLEADVERALRWSQDTDGRLTVFLSGPVAGSQKVTVRGRLPIAGSEPSGVVFDEKRPLPILRLERCDVRSTTVRVYGRPSVLVTVESPASDAAATQLGSDSESALGRPVATIAWRGVQQPRAVVTVKSAPAPVSAPAARLKSTADGTQSARARPIVFRPDADPLAPRLLAAGCALLLGALTILAWRRGWLRPLTRRPWAAGLMLGVAWWLWLSPSALGLLIALVCGLVAVRRRMVQTSR